MHLIPTVCLLKGFLLLVTNKKEGASRWAEGGTNVVKYANNKGLVWYLKNNRKSVKDNIIGAGVATIAASSKGAKAQPHNTMWKPWERF